MSIKKVTLLVLLLIILIFAFSFLNKSQGNKFQGNVVSVGNNMVIVKGGYEEEIKNSKNQYDLSIKVDRNTKIVKTSFYKPPTGMFNMDTVQKDTADTDFATLKKDSENVPLGIEVTLEGKFFKRAVEIRYIGPKY